MGFREKLQRILISVWPFLEWTKTLDRSFKLEKKLETMEYYWLQRSKDKTGHDGKPSTALDTTSPSKNWGKTGLVF